jgi:hypothetical protein
MMDAPSYHAARDVRGARGSRLGLPETVVEPGDGDWAA